MLVPENVSENRLRLLECINFETRFLKNEHEYETMEIWHYKDLILRDHYHYNGKCCRHKNIWFRSKLSDYFQLLGMQAP